MSSRMRRPETVTLSISRGDWLVVKKRLTAGENRQLYGRMFSVNGTGARVDPILVGLSKSVAYLVDWNITDADDKPLVIRDQPPDVVMAILDALDADDYQEIQRAIEAHIDAMDAERDAEKNGQDGERSLLAISPSAESSTGPLSMSGISTETSMPSSSKSSRKKAATP